MAIDENKVLQNAMDWLPGLFVGESSGHDWQHSLHVYRTAMQLAARQRPTDCDKFVLALAALLHDADDRKLFGEEAAKTLPHARLFLTLNGVDKAKAEQVCAIIGGVSFSSGLVPDSLEGKIVQDADRLDAIGAIGIARTFAYGGSHGRPLYLPGETPEAPLALTPEQYKARSGTSIDHFYEKLLTLKDRMNTDAARALAQQRHQYMLGFLQQFYAEWNAEI